MHSIDSNMARRHTSRGPLFDAAHEGKVIVTNSTEPGLDSARVLHALGRTGQLEVWDRVLPYARYRIDIVKGSELTVREGDGLPRHVKFESFAPGAMLGGNFRFEDTQVAPRLKKAPTESLAIIVEQSELAATSGLLAGNISHKE